VIEIVPVPAQISLVESAAGLVGVPERELPVLDDDIVRATLEQMRR
jgi:hypothetical protein